MRAVVAEPGAHLVRIAEVPPPTPAEGEVLVAVSAISVNRGELHRLRKAKPGWRPGWDFAGTVVESRCSDPALRPGRRVFGIALRAGAWAQRVAVRAEALAPLPAALAEETAAALPVAGVTAQRVLRLAGTLRGRRVLVTGAAGGVGRFATQLAHLAGAEVTAVVGRAERAAGLAALGADHIVTRLDAPAGSVDVILDSVGGSSLERAFDLVAPGGLIVTFGNSASALARIPLARFYPKQAVLRGYYLLDDLRTHPPAGDLAELAAGAAQGRLRVEIEPVRGIDALPEVLRVLAERRVAGKAVLAMR